MANSSPKLPKHHYIPEFYLKQWAGDDGRLVEFCRRHSNRVVARPTHPGGTGYVRGLYAVEGRTKELQNIFESKFFGVTDNLAAEALVGMIENHDVPSGPRKTAWSRFMMSLMYRTPEGVARASSMIETVLEKDWAEFETHYLQHRAPHEPTTFEEFIEKSWRGVARAQTMASVSRLIDSERTGEALNKMRWGMIHFDKVTYKLLASDRPFAMTNGIGIPGAHFVMPISPRHIFVASDSLQTENGIRALVKGERIIKILNDRVCSQARKFVYGSDRTQLEFIAKRLGRKITCSPFE